MPAFCLPTGTGRWPGGELGPRHAVHDGNLTYAIDVLERPVPAHTGPVTLFIDPLGRPLSPVSVCGVRRHERRRDRRGI